MSRHSIGLDPTLQDYLESVTVHESAVMRRLREETAAMAEASMQISADQGQFMTLMAETIGARNCIEIGVFTGYSALAVMRGLPPDGRILALDVSAEYTAIARRYWAEARVGERIDLRLAPAIETLDALIAEGARGSYDFAFIDADKENYLGYYERCMTLLRPGGLILIDNVLWNGGVADPTDTRESTRAIRAVNARIHTDSRVTATLVPVGDGVFVCRRKA